MSKSKDKNNVLRAKLLGMPFGTANQRLRKSIMFDLAKKCNMDTCFRCNKKIDKIEDLSIEHKVPWQNGDDPVKLFFDTDNIAFSHLSCNSAARTFPNTEEHKRKVREGFLANPENGKRIKSPKGTSWCYKCKQYLSLKKFYRSAKIVTGVEDICKSCKKARNK